MTNSPIADDMVASMLSMAPEPVSYITQEWLDYRHSDPGVQVVDLQKR